MFDKFNRDIADNLGVSPDALYVAIVALIFAFAVGFVYGYHISIEHFLDMINKHQLEHGLPTFNRDWTGA